MSKQIDEIDQAFNELFETNNMSAKRLASAKQIFRMAVRWRDSHPSKSVRDWMDEKVLISKENQQLRKQLEEPAFPLDDASREEKLKWVSHLQATKFSTRYGYTSIEDACLETAKWADNNQPDPWVYDRPLTREDGEHCNIAVAMCVDSDGGDGRVLGLIPCTFVFMEEPDDDGQIGYWNCFEMFYNTSDIYCWMPIPKPKHDKR